MRRSIIVDHGNPDQILARFQPKGRLRRSLRACLVHHGFGISVQHAERITYNRPIVILGTACIDLDEVGNTIFASLVLDFSWNQQRSAAVVFVQFLNWPRYLPIPVGFDARYYILELDRLPERPDQSSKLTGR